MSLPILHTAVGISLPFLVGLALFLKKKKLGKKALISLALTMAICGLWATVPDIPRYLPSQYKHFEQDITDSKYGNIFFFHKFLDTHQAEDRGNLEGLALLFAMFFLTLFAAAKSIMANKKEIEDLDKKAHLAKGLSEERSDHKNIIDLHCHVLAGVDDGPADMDESVEMCKRMVELGITSVVATPHLPWKGKYDVEKIFVEHHALKERLAQEDIALEVFLGTDIRITWDIIDKLKRGEVLTLGKSRYFLLELDNFTVPVGLEKFISQCHKEDLYPVLSHPERNGVLQRDLHRFKKLASLPMLTQITASSLAERSGKAIKMAAVRFLEEGLVDIISSDAHPFGYRLDDFKQGLAAAESIVGKDRLRQMITIAPQMVINNDNIEDIKGLTCG